MQDATSNLTQALSGSSVVWEPRVSIDWAQDGHGGTGTIDDLTGQLGEIRIPHSMDDGLPDEMSFLSGGVPTLSGNLSGGTALVDGTYQELTPAQYFSPFNTDSPVYGYERDLQPVTADLAVVTAGGVETTRLFTGRLQDTPVTGGRASMSALSETRIKLAQLVQLPSQLRFPLERVYPGLDATWPVSFACWACGVYAAPPPQTDTRLYLPMHGGGFPFLPSGNPLDATSRYDTHGFDFPADPLAPSDEGQLPVPFIRGPYVGAAFGEVKAARVRGHTGGVNELEPGPQFWTQQSSTGRWEMWVRGDANDNVNTTIAGSGSLIVTSFTERRANLAGFGYTQTGSNGLEAGIGPSREIYISLWDPTYHTYTGPTLPSDGEWHFVGIAWSGTSNKVWFNLDGAVTTQTITPSIVTANLITGLTGIEGDIVSAVNFYLPTAEIHLTGGTAADPDDGNPWVNQQTWTTSAAIYPSGLQLEALAETQPREAFQLITSYAQSEFAATSIDENDVFHYRPRGYFGTTEAQTTRQVLDTSRHADLPDVALDRTKIRTVCRLSYEQTRLVTIAEIVQDVKTVIAIPPGVSILRVAFSSPVAHLRAGVMNILTAAELANPALFPQWSFACINSNTTGTGTIATATEIDIQLTEWTPGEAVVTVDNLTSSVWYFVNDGTGVGYPYIGFWGNKVDGISSSVTEQYDAGVTLRGSIALTTNLARIQREEDARRMARRLVIGHSFPIPVIKTVELFGDPTRQVGDLVTFTDQVETGASGSWRIHGLTHTAGPGKYTQTGQLQRARLRGVWGDGVSKWGRVVWAGQELP